MSNEARIASGGRSYDDDEISAAAAVPASAPAPLAPARRTRVLPMLFGGALALAAMAGAGVYLLRPAAPPTEVAPASGAAADLYVDAPPIIVSVHGADGRAHFIKLRFVVVARSKGKAELLKERMPMLLDALQSFLRELRAEDLDGSAAVYRVKEEMMLRIRAAIGDDSVSDVLIQDLVEQ
ncbi:flagellar basal body-associated FliL family protein [Sphingomonas morindae]|uniref:Flagellar protein FliL n=1 Tax=Sphingomonas morindae TaxID=1541170 RepID=A0ABY4X514_9SPHN|nr:flagellar basal body-associated FliL family protein [Sphingomonas morindae]USI71983.1 flagellar basal body-associated FliL family protein [Sphingomonas morindae]